MSTFLTPKVVKNPTIPTKLSQLTNDMEFARDPNYVHTDNNFSDRYKEMLDNSESSYQVITEAKDAADRANKAATIAESVTTNTPKVINKYWYIYNKDTDIYESTGVKAEGESFKIVKSYASVSDMEADFGNPLINIGEFVIIDSNVQDPDNSKLYVKTENSYKYLTDMSGATGITGKSAYEIAIEKGFIGTEEEWIASLSEDSKQAALLVESKLEQVDSSLDGLSDVKEELNHLKIELTDTNSEIKSAEEQRVTNETVRSEAETNRVNAESARITAESQRETLKNELTTLKGELTDTIDSANVKVGNLESKVNDAIKNMQSETSTTLDEANAKIINLEVKGNTAVENVETALLNYENKISEVDQTISNATNTVNQLVTDSQNLINTHISDSTTQINEAISRTEIAIENANTATDNTNSAISNANTQANRAKLVADNPPKIINKYWCLYDETQGQYVSTGILAEGQKGEMGTGVTIKGTLESEGQLPIEANEGDGYLINGYLYIYVISGGNVESNPAWSNVGEIKGPKGDTAEVTKEAVEAVLTGTITSHDHDGVYLKDANSDSKQYVRYNGNWTELNLSSVEPYNISYANGEVITEEQYNELLNAILNKKRIMYDSTHTAILAMGNETYIRFDLISSLKWFAIQILKEDLTVRYLGNDIASADDIYSLETKEFDHIPSESDTDYLIPNTEELTPYKIGTFALYNGKLYQLYSLANNKADWREVVNRDDIITVNKASEELKQAIEALSTVEESGTIDDTTYNTLSTLIDGEQFYLNGKTYVVSKEDNVIKLTTDDSIITITDKVKTSVENSITNTDGNIVIKNNNATATISLTGDGTKFLNDAGEYITVDTKGLKALTDEEYNLINSINTEIISDDTYNILIELYNKNTTYYYKNYIVYFSKNALELKITLDYPNFNKTIRILSESKSSTVTTSTNADNVTTSGITLSRVKGNVANQITLVNDGSGDKVLANNGEYISTVTESVVDDKISQAVASVYKVKGSVDNYETLPTDATIGDVYNLIDTGANYVCVSTDPITWDKLSETFDTSNIYTKSDITLITNGDGTKFLNDSGNYIEVPTSGIIPLNEEDAVIFDYFSADSGELTEEQYNKVIEVYNKSKAWYYNNSLYFFTWTSSLTLYSSTFDGFTNLTKITIVESTKDYIKQVSAFYIESTASKITINTDSDSITLDKSGDGTKYLNDKGEYTVIAGGSAEVAISSVKPSNNESLWIDTATEGTSDVYNKEESDARYALKNTSYTKEESDNLYTNKDSVLKTDGSYNSPFYPNEDYDPATKYYVDTAKTEIYESVLTKDNQNAYTPYEAYHPATKTYVDNRIAESVNAKWLTISPTSNNQMNVECYEEPLNYRYKDWMNNTITILSVYGYTEDDLEKKKFFYIKGSYDDIENVERGTLLLGSFIVTRPEDYQSRLSYPISDVVEMGYIPDRAEFNSIKHIYCYPDKKIEIVDYTINSGEIALDGIMLIKYKNGSQGIMESLTGDTYTPMQGTFTYEVYTTSHGNYANTTFKGSDKIIIGGLNSEGARNFNLVDSYYAGVELKTYYLPHDRIIVWFVDIPKIKVETVTTDTSSYEAIKLYGTLNWKYITRQCTQSQYDSFTDTSTVDTIFYIKD